MADKKDIEIEQLLRELREKKSKSTKLAHEISVGKERHEEQQRATAELEKLTAPVAVSAEDETDAEDIFTLKTESPTEGTGESRSFRDIMSDTTDAFDQKGMIPKNIERGFDAIEIETLPPPKARQERVRTDPSKHPLFTTPNPTAELERQRSAPVRGEKPVATVSGEMRLDEAGDRRRREGVINVKEKVDDEFREFFGDTVIIDRQPIDTKQGRQRKITDFVISSDDEAGGPVFEDDSAPRALDEYRSEEDTELILDELVSRRAKSLWSTVLTGVAAAVLLILNITLHYQVPFATALAANHTLFAGINAAAALLAAIIGIKQIGRGLLGLISFKGNNDSLYALGALAAVAEPVYALLLEDASRVFIAAPVGVTALFFAFFGRSVFVSGILSNFRTISTGFEKYAAYIPSDNSFHSRITRGLEIENPTVLVKRKTGFTDNFLKYAFSLDTYSDMFRIAAPLMLIASLGAGVLIYLKQNDITAALAGFFVAACLASSFTATLKSVLPLKRMQNKLSRFGTSVPGFAAARELSAANTVLLDGGEIFPKGSIMLHGIKTFEKERIDKAILYAASVLIPHCDTLAPIFRNVIQGKTEMLYSAESVEYEDGLGFCCWIDKSRILIGSREMMEAHEISVPTLDYEIRYTKTRSRDAIYLAVGGVLYAMFVVSYTLSSEVEEIMNSLDREGMSVLVRTNDFNITAKKISDIFSVPQSMVGVLRESEVRLAVSYTAYSAHSESILNHIGSLSSFCSGLFASRKLGGALKLTNIVVLVSMIIGVAASLLLAVVGFPFEISLMSLLLFEGAWLAVVWILSRLWRY